MVWNMTYWCELYTAGNSFLVSHACIRKCQLFWILGLSSHRIRGTSLDSLLIPLWITFYDLGAFQMVSLLEFLKKYSPFWYHCNMGTATPFCTMDLRISLLGGWSGSTKLKLQKVKKKKKNLSQRLCCRAFFYDIDVFWFFSHLFFTLPN